MNAASPVQARTSGKAIAALVLGICGIVVFPLLGVIGLFVGYSARREIGQHPALGGEGFATAGIVLGWIAVALLAIGLFILIALLVAI